jgi:hypothetical protein
MFQFGRWDAAQQQVAVGQRLQPVELIEYGIEMLARRFLGRSFDLLV